MRGLPSQNTTTDVFVHTPVVHAPIDIGVILA
jgi:hypothetical protein